MELAANELLVPSWDVCHASVFVRGNTPSLGYSHKWLGLSLSADVLHAVMRNSRKVPPSRPVSPAATCCFLPEPP